jgi:hypothetical protein
MQANQKSMGQMVTKRVAHTKRCSPTELHYRRGMKTDAYIFSVMDINGLEK